MEEFDYSNGYTMKIEPKYACLGSVTIAKYNEFKDRFITHDLKKGTFELKVIEGMMVDIAGTFFPAPGKKEKEVHITVENDTQTKVFKYTDGDINLSL
jgi:hypothetical protein